MTAQVNEYKNNPRLEREKTCVEVQIIGKCLHNTSMSNNSKWWGKNNRISTRVKII